jgi:hypothetical protein
MGFLWVCGIRSDVFNSRDWELVGVYTDRSLAVRACRGEHYFIFPILANIECASGLEVPAGMEFPLREPPANSDWESPRIPK